MGSRNEDLRDGYRLAAWPRRAAAHLLDVLPFTIPLTLLAKALGSGLIFALGLPLVLIVYTAFTYRRQGRHNGQTFGKQLLKVQVVREDGGSVDLGYALKREFLVKYLLIAALSFVTFGLFWLINYLRPIWHPRRQAWHDHFARSLVIDLRR
jgi:uncharacterized RDD family membrane protein YckC